MKPKAFESRYKSLLHSLFEGGRITDQQLEHFLKRGIQILNPAADFGLNALGQILPEIVISACPSYINKMKIPYQATSFVGASTKMSSPASYVYKLPGKIAGGVPLLSGGSRRIGDNVFASTHRILLGSKAVIISALNLMVNKDKIWNWKFFGNFVKESRPEIYLDLDRLDKKLNQKKSMRQVVIARSDCTFKRLKIVEEYRNNKIAVLDPENKIKVIFLTNQRGYDYASKAIGESDLVQYITTGDYFDGLEALKDLRRKFRIEILLNDGGRQMSNGFRDLDILAEERITLEPFPGKKIIPDIEEIDPTSIMAMDGLGIDGNELEHALRISSIKIGEESANVYSYPLNESLIF
jgi:hypothetical protein